MQTFDAVGVRNFDKHWQPDTITLVASESEVDLTGKNLGAADIELVSACVFMYKWRFFNRT